MKLVLTSLILLLLAGCASTPPERFNYLLRSDKDVSSRPLSDVANIHLGELSIATYIDQPGLVLAVGDSRIHSARYHEWAEPLGISLRRFVTTEISYRLGKDLLLTPTNASGNSRIDINIDQLHGNGEGEALLVAYWTMVQGGQSNTFQFAQRQLLSADGYGALVIAEKALLEAFCVAVAESL